MKRVSEILIKISKSEMSNGMVDLNASWGRRNAEGLVITLSNIRIF